jgi:hypothetical protein
VSKIQWGKGYAALKEFVIQPESEDDRYFYDVYEYELKVLYNLRPLWGKYVPALLFHKPWATSPVIGLQLGGANRGRLHRGLAEGGPGQGGGNNRKG